MIAVDTAPDYADTMEAIAKQYNDRILAMLEAMRGALAEAGYTSVEPFQMWDDNYRWAFATHNADGVVGSGSADFTVSIAEQHDYEGEESPAGINWGLDIVAYGGLILGGLSPYNYTDQVWVDSADADAVLERYTLLHKGIHESLDTLGEMVEKARAEDD